jgi:hypothetical protein
MGSLRSDLETLRHRLRDGSIQRAYMAFVSYMSGLRAQFTASHRDWTTAGLYQGYFDMTYFAVVTPALKARDLKLAIVFDYGTFRFQVWLAARNRDIQRRYWQILRDGGWSAASLVRPAVGVDAIVALDAADGLDLEDPASVSAAIERTAVGLLHEVEAFLDSHDAQAV